MKKLLIQKFGGTSVADLDRLRNVMRIVQAARSNGADVVVVLSAMAGETDRLITLAKEASTTPNPREYDNLISTGEMISSSILSILLNANNHPAKSMTGRQAGIETDDWHKKAHIENINIEPLRKELAAGIIPVVAGFQGVNPIGDTATLGRGGSDTTAVAIAAALKADECQIFTDVDGVYTSDPRVVPAAQRLDKITLKEMLEMASLGAKVLQNRAVRFAGRYQVPLRVLSSFVDGPGTLITYEEFNMEKPIVTSIAFNRSEAKLTVWGIPDQAGVAAYILGVVAEANIDVDMILQNPDSEGHINFTFTVHRDDYQRALAILQDAAKHLNAREATGDNRIAKVSAIGVGMRTHIGVGKILFNTLAQEGIPVQLVTTSEIKMSVVLDEKYLELAARSLHTAFGLDSELQEEFDPIPATA
jgi:aspartate kinase